MLITAVLIPAAGCLIYNVMVLKCTHYTTRITLNVSHTGCTVVSELGFKLGSLVWRTGSLPIKPSGPAWLVNDFAYIDNY